MKRINIHGEITSQDWFGGCYTHNMIVKDLEDAGGEDITISLNSIGGDVFTGFAIYSEIRRYAKEHDAEVTIIAQGICASIATIIFLAGDKRIVSQYVSPFVHNAWSYTEGSSGDFSKVAQELKDVDKMIAKHYADHTDLTEEEALELMNAETWITPEDCVDVRFATEIEVLSRPLNKLRARLKTNNMSRKRKPANAKAKRQGLIANLRKFLSPSNSIELYTADNTVIVFPDLDEGEEPKVGDTATIDGVQAEGEHTMPNGEVYVFDGGKLEQIREAYSDPENVLEPETVEEAIEEIEELEKEKEELEKENEDLEKEIEELKEEIEELEEVLNKVNAKILAMTKSKGSPANSKDAPRKRKTSTTGADAVANLGKGRVNKRK